jgi:hypothetical protein
VDQNKLFIEPPEKVRYISAIYIRWLLLDTRQAIMANALRSSIFRPTSHTPQSSDAAQTDKATRSITKLSLSGFKKPPPTRSMTLPQAATTQDGSYLQVLSLKLSEAVSKALAQPAGSGPGNECLNGRRPIPAGRGRAFGSLIAM